MSTIIVTFSIGGVLTDVTSMKLQDPANQYGVRRADNAALVVAAGTAMTHAGTGTYSYTFADPITPPPIYEYRTQRIYLGVTSYSDPALTADISTAAIVLPPTYPLTSEDEIRELYSSLGVDFRIDDLTLLQQATMWNRLIGKASDDVAAYTLHRYNTSGLVNSQWVRNRATIIAAWYLSGRRGNPRQFEQLRTSVIEDLEKVLNGNPPLIIPGAFVRAADVPEATNYILDDRYRIRKNRRVAETSTPGSATGDQDNYGDPFFFER